MALNAFLKLSFLVLLLPLSLSAQWSNTVHQAVGLPDTLSRFSIQTNFPMDTIFWIGSDIILETNVSMSGIKESVFDYFIKSDRFKWVLTFDKWNVLKPIQYPLPKLDGMVEQVKLKIYIPEYFKPSTNNLFILASLKE